MFILFEKVASRGEWFEIGIKVTDPTVKTRTTPVNITGKAVSLVVRDGPLETDTSITVEEPLTTILDGPNGLAAIGGRINTPGTYYGTATIGASTDGSGWPLKSVVKFTIEDCP